MPFFDSLDIANRSCQHLGATRIASPTEDSVNNAEISFTYDKVRRAELMRNNWKCAIKKAVLRPIDTTTYLMQPAQWNAATQYLPGSVVADANGQLWISNQANNIGNDPNLTDVWDAYFGSMTVDAYSSGTVYFAGDLAYIQNADSSYTIYLSTQNDNAEAPNVPDLWSATATYQQDQMVVDGSGQMWRSLIALNTNNALAQGPANWIASQTYEGGDTVTAADGFIYESVNGSTGINPLTDDGTNWTNLDLPNAWTMVPNMPTSSGIWVPLYAALVSLNIAYPIGVGPLSQQTTKNIFRLPAGYLRKAPQDPKAGMYSFLGAPAYNMQEDWEIEGQYLVSQCATPIILRFIADLISVRLMDDLFCELLAARIGYETCETITNSNAKQQTCNNAYNKARNDAIITNLIEVGPTMPPEDDYIVCRL